MWALKPPRRPAKKRINQETPERTPPEPDAAPEGKKQKIKYGKGR